MISGRTSSSRFILFPSRSDVPDRKLTSDEEEAKRIAEMGKPVLGENSKLEIIIEESYEFKVGSKPGLCFSDRYG